MMELESDFTEPALKPRRFSVSSTHSKKTTPENRSYRTTSKSSKHTRHGESPSTKLPTKLKPLAAPTRPSSHYKPTLRREAHASNIEAVVPLAKAPFPKESVDKDGIHCQICRFRNKKKLAGQFCTECTLPLCKICADQHQATKVTQGHRIVPMRDQGHGGDLCAMHRFAAVDYFCDSCSTLICVNCTMLEHRGHAVVELSEKVSQCKSSLRSGMDGLDIKMATTSNELQKVVDLENGIEDSRKEIKKQIADKMAELQKKLTLQQNQLCVSLDHFLNSKRDFLTKRKDNLKKRFDEMMKIRKSTEGQHLNKKREVFINKVMEVEKQVELISEGKPLNESEFTSLQFVLTNNGQFGKLDESNESMIRIKGHGKVAESVLSTPSMTNKQVHNQPKMIARDSHKSHAVALKPVPEELRFKNWKNARILHKFKTSSFVKKPSGLGVLPNGKIVIADAAQQGVVICDTSGRFQQRVLVDEVQNPNGLTIDTDGNIVISCDKFIKTFTIGGEKIGQLPSLPCPGPLVIDEENYLIVKDTKTHHVTIYDRDGKPISKFFTVDQSGQVPDSSVLEASDGRITLAYTLQGSNHHLKSFSYSGDIIHSTKLTEPCYGIRQDHNGNMIIAGGDLCFASGLAARNVMALKTLDKSGRVFSLAARGVALTPHGDVVTLHVNSSAMRSEVVILQLSE